jgi:hypothetical protein
MSHEMFKPMMVFFPSGGAGTVQELKRDIHGLIAAKTNFHLGKKNII